MISQVLKNSLYAATVCCTLPAYCGFFSQHSQNQEETLAASLSVDTNKPKNLEDHTNQGDLRKEGTMPPAYSAPAQVDVATSHDDWYITGSYLYWTAIQEGLSVAKTTADPASDRDLNVQAPEQEPEYKSGFKVGLGTYISSHDGWGFNLGYTQFDFTTEDLFEPKTGSVFNNNFWLSPENGATSLSTLVESTWDLDYRMGLMTLSRSYYNGSCLTFDASFGVAGGWLSQKFDLDYLIDTVSTTSSNKSTAWMVGPRGSIATNWLLGAGFRLFGDLGLNLLYTRYYKVSTEQSDSEGVLSGNAFSAHKQFDRVRAIAEAGLGLGWGMYVNNSRQHIDFSASYDFTYLPGQNMMRFFQDELSAGSAGSPGDLFFHGLTASFRFDF